MKRIKAKGRRRRRRRWWEHGAHRRPPNLVKNFAVSLVFQARLHFGAEHRGRDIERGGEGGGGRLDDAPLLFFLRFAFPRFPMPSFGRRNYFQVFIQFAGEEGERQEDWQEAAGIEREPPCVTNFSSTQHSSHVCLLLRAKGFCQSIRRKKKFVASNFLTPSILDSIMGTNNSWKNSLPSFFEPTILSPLIPIINGER